MSEFKPSMIDEVLLSQLDRIFDNKAWRTKELLQINPELVDHVQEVAILLKLEMDLRKIFYNEQDSTILKEFRAENNYNRYMQAFDELLICSAELEQAPYPNKSVPDSNCPPLEGYQITRKLGKGGYGVVFEATDCITLQKVAIKFLVKNIPLISKDRFELERKILGELNHPNIVHVHHRETDTEYPVLIMELADGGSLRHWMAERKISLLPPKIVAQIIVNIAAGVRAAHEKGCIHRDLKPENLLVFSIEESESDLKNHGFCWEGKWFIVKVGDFGLVKDLSQQSITQTSTILGTLNYLSPEQVYKRRFGDISPASDVFSLGAIGYELITTRPPFAAHTVAETLWALTDEAHDAQDICAVFGWGEHTFPTSTNLDGPPLHLPDLDRIILKCIEKQPCDRWQTMSHLETTLRTFLAGEKVRVKRKSKWVRNLGIKLQRKPVVTSVIMGVVLILFIILVTWSSVLQPYLAKKNQAQNIHEVRLNHARENVADKLIEVDKLRQGFVKSGPSLEIAEDRRVTLTRIVQLESQRFKALAEVGIEGDELDIVKNRLETSQHEQETAVREEQLLAQLLLTEAIQYEFRDDGTISEFRSATFICQALHEYGFTIEPEEESSDFQDNDNRELNIGKRIANDPMREAIIMAIDNLIRILHSESILPDKRWKRLLRIAIVADAEYEYRNNIRKALLNNDRVKLLELANKSENWISDYQTVLVAASNLLVAGEKNAAINLLESSLLRISHWRLFFLLGDAYSDVKKLDLAKIAYIASVKLNTNNPAALNNLIKIYFEGGELVNAAVSCEQLTKIAPTWLRAWNLRRFVARALKKSDEAKASAQELLRLAELKLALNSKNYLARGYRGIAHRELNSKPQAIEDFEAVSGKETGEISQALIQKNLAILYWQTRKFSLAKEQANKVLTVNANDAEANYVLGLSLMGLGHYIEAEVPLSKGVAGLPKTSERAANLAKCKDRTKIEINFMAYVAKSKEPPSQDILPCAEIAGARQMYAAATFFYQALFADNSATRTLPTLPYKSLAAATAAAAGCGLGMDAPTDAVDKAKLRQFSYSLLNEICRDLKQLLQNHKTQELVNPRLSFILSEPLFDGVREPMSQAKLPKEEQEQFRKLWLEFRQIQDQLNVQIAEPYSKTQLK